jgi:hypothetical protein
MNHTNRRQMTSRNIQSEESLVLHRIRRVAASEASTSPADCVSKPKQNLTKARSQRRSSRSMHFANRRSVRRNTSFFSPIHDLLPNAVPIEIPARESARSDLICKDNSVLAMLIHKELKQVSTKIFPAV